MSVSYNVFSKDTDYIPLLRTAAIRSAITNLFLACVPAIEVRDRTTILMRSYEMLSEKLGPDFAPMPLQNESIESTALFFQQPCEPFPTKSLIKVLEGGLSGNLFKEICDLLDISEKRLAGIINLSVSTLAQRKKRGYFSATESERLYRILNLYKKAVQTFDGDPEEAREWLKSSAFGLGDAIPLDFARTEVGAKEVERLLTRIDEGIFS